MYDSRAKSNNKKWISDPSFFQSFWNKIAGSILQDPARGDVKHRFEAKIQFDDLVGYNFRSYVR